MLCLFENFNQILENLFKKNIHHSHLLEKLIMSINCRDTSKLSCLSCPSGCWSHLNRAQIACGSMWELRVLSTLLSNAFSFYYTRISDQILLQLSSDFLRTALKNLHFNFFKVIILKLVSLCGILVLKNKRHTYQKKKNVKSIYLLKWI